MAGDLKTNKNNKKNGEDMGNPTNLDTTATETCKRYYNARGARIGYTAKVAKHPPNPPRRQRIHPKQSPRRQRRQSICQRKGRQSIRQTTTIATRTMLTSEGRRTSRNPPERADDHHQQSFKMTPPEWERRRRRRRHPIRKIKALTRKTHRRGGKRRER